MNTRLPLALAAAAFTLGCLALTQDRPPSSAEPADVPASSAYDNPTFGYSVDLPSGWRPATEFMAAMIGPLGDGPIAAAGNPHDFAVFTNMTTEAESQFVEEVPDKPALLSGIGVWLEFFLMDSVEIVPTTRDRAAQLHTADEGSVRHIVSDIHDISLAGYPATRYRLEHANDDGVFVYDRVFVETAVGNCPDCTGYIIQTGIAGRPSYLPETDEPPPAAYPVAAFEHIFQSLVVHAASPTPRQLPDTGGSPDPR